MPEAVMVNSRTPIPVQADRMGAIEDRLGNLGRQIATGERFTDPSEDPGGANRAAMLARLDSSLASDQRSLQRAAARLSLAEISVRTAGEALVRARELGLAAASGTFSADDRVVMAREVAVLREQLFDSANARDESGRYLFAGATGAAPAYVVDANGVAGWAGMGAGAGAEAAGIREAGPPRGPQLFGADVDGAFASLALLAAALEEPEAEIRTAQFAQVLTGLETGYNRLLDGQSRIGAGLSRLEGEGIRVSAARLQTAESLAQVRGLDMTAAIVELEALKLTLSAAQASFSRIFEGTLFDRLG